jgi:alanyl-tRNA synthetase
MELATVREKFLQFFQSKGYKILPGSSLVPENDPSVLFTTAGMQQFKDFYSHPSEAPASAVATAQPVIRTSDIAEVGDDTHLTSFEMLGNFKFGEAEAYKMKERAIKEAWQFVNLELGVEKERVHATVFKGDDTTPTSKEPVGKITFGDRLATKVRADRRARFISTALKFGILFLISITNIQITFWSLGICKNRSGPKNQNMLTCSLSDLIPVLA